MSPETRTAVPGLPWEKIIGMRHRLVHAYFDINLDILWKTVQEGLPQLVQTLATALDED
ncbi:MAG: HepT-like ribonuclease domain-containing protein [Desulfobacca sp.]|uniref:HepT-like ribonuclease domain-containing protein n=1 Tax=Desulfobacca sp. TaxID=2067990 RepID=UPI00404B5C8A